MSPRDVFRKGNGIVMDCIDVLSANDFKALNADAINEHVTPYDIACTIIN